MKTLSRLAVGVWVVLLALVPLAAALAQTDEPITLAPFADPTLGLQGLAPEGWREAGPGVYVRGRSALDVATLVQQVAPPNMSLEDFQAMLATQLTVEALPESVGTLETEAYTWTLYVVPVSALGMDITVDVALTEGEAGIVLALLQCLTAEYETLHQAVFLPAVEALAPLAGEAAPAEELPYLEEEVTFANETAEGITLAGTLTLPPGDGPHPAVVLISGSGAQDRDESLAPVATIKPFRLIADHLTRHGIAVLRYDDRGVGESTGDFQAASGQDLASDASAAVDYLRTRDDINPAQVGILGHSEGGALAPLVAINNPDVAFVIAMAGTGVNGAEVLLLQNERLLRAGGASEAEVAAQVAFVERMIDLTLQGDWDALETLVVERTIEQLESAPAEETAGIDDIEAFARESAAQQMPMFRNWFPFFFRYDPAEDWARVTVPVLALFGGRDLQVIAEQNAPPLEAALEAGGNPDYTVVTIPTANHLFQDAVTGTVDEYGELPPEFHPDFLPTITDWLLARVDVAGE